MMTMMTKMTMMIMMTTMVMVMMMMMMMMMIQIQIQIQIHLYVQYMSENMETPKSASESPLFLFKVRFSGSASGISVGALRVAILSCHPGMGQDL